MTSTCSSSNPTPARVLGLLGLLVMGWLAVLVAGCGHKAPPVPPPLENPAQTRDLALQQRGDELILTFTFPQTTVSGLALSGLQKVEYWELRKPLRIDEPEEAEGEAPDDSEAPEEAADGDAAEAMPDDSEGQAGDDPGNADDMDGEDSDSDAEEDEEPPPPPPTKEQMAAVEALEFVATSQVRLTLEGADLEAATVGDKIVVRLPFEPLVGAPRSDDAEDVEVAYTFGVKTFVDDRTGSNLSNIVTQVRREAPAPPEGFMAEAEAGGIRISWDNPEARQQDVEASDETEGSEDGDSSSEAALAGKAEDGAAEETPSLFGYRVYRRDAQSRNYGEPIGSPGPKADQYLDRTAQYGSRYIYTLTAVEMISPLVESALAGEREIDYRDRFAPPAPRNVIALAEPGRVRLLWDASPAPDLAGYIVLRREGTAGDDADAADDGFERLNEEPVVDLEYDDRDVLSGRVYQYRVLAVDEAGNEGETGETATARVP